MVKRYPVFVLDWGWRSWDVTIDKNWPDFCRFIFLQVPQKAQSSSQPSRHLTDLYGTDRLVIRC
jgi:hypothetical protein